LLAVKTSVPEKINKDRSSRLKGSGKRGEAGLSSFYTQGKGKALFLSYSAP